MEQVIVSFPGLGIEELTLNKIAFSLFGGKIEVRYYGIIITLGIILAVAYCMYRSRECGMVPDNVLDMAIYTVIFGVIGARLYYVLMTIGEYHSFLDVIAIWNGGLAIYGGVIGGGLAIYIYCRIKKFDYRQAFDMVAPSVMIGQILGRWGNFFNGEAYGYEVVEGHPLYFLRMGLIPNINSSTKMYYFHPTFLYESVWNLIGFLVINALFKKRKFNGQVFCMYIAWYGFGRMFIEGLRTDSLYLGVFRVSQVVGFLCFAVGTVLLILGLRKAHIAKAAEGAYTSCYAACHGVRDINGEVKEEAKKENAADAVDKEKPQTAEADVARPDAVEETQDGDKN